MTQQLFVAQLQGLAAHKRCPHRKAKNLQSYRRLRSSAGGAAAATPAEDGNQQGLVPAAKEVAPEVLEALARVQEAMAEAETTLENLESLPSAREPSQWEERLEHAKPALQALALLAFCFASHSFGTAVRLIGSLLAALAMGLGGYRRGSLNPSGVLAAVAVGWATLGSSFRGGLTLLTFFFTSSKLTQMGEEEKAVDEEHKKGGQRDWKQVACNALVPTLLAVAAASLTGARDVALRASMHGRAATALLGAFLGYYACCCGDTWASELGQLSSEQPVLITSMRPVRKGTNGGVTLLGLAASVAGGLCMGLTFWLAGAASPTGAGAAAALQQWPLVAAGVGAGLAGSLIDSLLGATVQFSGYNRITGKITGRPGPDVTPISGLAILDNNAVNAASASLTALLTGLACLLLFP